MALRANLPCLGEVVIEERRLVHQGGDMSFLGHSGLCGCARVCVLEVGEFFAKRGVVNAVRSADVFSLDEYTDG